MSKASGRPLSDYDWVELSLRIPGYPVHLPLRPLTDHNREKIISQLGTIMSCLSDIHFDKIGSLFEDSTTGNCSIGECLNPSLIWQWRDRLNGIDRGPFQSQSQYLSSLISAFTSHAKNLPLTPHSFFAPIPNPFEYPHWTNYTAAIDKWRIFCDVGEDKSEGIKNRLAYCIAGQFLDKMIPYLTSTSGKFVLFHPDLHLGNVFVDDNLNITSIIDWSPTSSGPMPELLATPGFSGSVSPPTESLILAFRAGFSHKIHFESEEWEKAEMMWRFSRLVRLLSNQDYTLFKALYGLVHKAGSEDIPQLFYDQSVQEHGRELMAELRQMELEEEDEEEDEEEETGDQTDGEFGDTDESGSLDVARKLTLMSEMNPNFVADKRLWLWVESALKQAES